MKPLISIITIFLLISSCRKSDNLETITVPAFLKQMVPYIDSQVVRFKNNSGNIITSIVSVKHEYIERTSCATCEVYLREEFIRYNLMAGSMPFVQLSIDNRPYISLFIFSPDNGYQSGLGFNFSTMQGVAEPNCNTGRQTCLDSVIINGVTYYDVLEIDSGVTANDQLSKAYYTINKGLVGFRYGSGITYGLLE